MPSSSALTPDDTGAAATIFLIAFEVVIIQAVDGAKAGAQRRGDQRQAGGGADDGKVRQFQADGAGGWSLADDDIQREIFHGRVEHFFDGSPRR